MFTNIGHIFLIGMSGSGKSTVGPILARACRRHFLDTDEMVEAQSGRSIGDIFRQSGEDHFRDLETAAIRTVAVERAQPLVVALGGGAFNRDINRNTVSSSGISIYLQCSVREIYRRLNQLTNRPLLNVPPRPGKTMRQARLDAITSLLNGRRHLYRTADFTVSTSTRSPRQVVDEIMRRIERRYGQNSR